MTDSENDHADAAVVRAREKEIRLERVDVAVRDDHEERHMAGESLLRPFIHIGKHGLELRELYEHTEERARHGLRRQDQHLPPVRA
jgi:hypothetical protein